MTIKIFNKIQKSLPALSYPNFRWFWTGQLISLIGTWMQNIGQAWLVLQLTDSAFKLGVVNALQFLPLTLFSLFAGPFVDRFPKRRILLFTQTGLMLLALILATLTYLNIIEYWHLIVLALCLGMVNTLDIPARQAFVSELVERKSLMNAIALNSTIFNLGRVVGPAVAGLLIGLLGIANCFYLNALSFCAVIFGLWMIKLPPKTYEIKETMILKQIKEGLHYIRFNPLLLLPIILVGVVSTFVMNFNVLIPVFARESLDQNALGYGLLMTSMGIGSLIAALRLAAASKESPSMKGILLAAFGATTLLIVLGFEKTYWLACLTLMLIGFCSITFMASVNTTLQLNSEDRMRGRVLSVYSQVFGGFAPIGSLFAGVLSESVGGHMCISISGLVGLLAVIAIGYKFFKKHNQSVQRG